MWTSLKVDKKDCGQAHMWTRRNADKKECGQGLWTGGNVEKRNADKQKCGQEGMWTSRKVDKRECGQADGASPAILIISVSINSR